VHDGKPVLVPYGGLRRRYLQAAERQHAGYVQRTVRQHIDVEVVDLDGQIVVALHAAERQRDFHRNPMFEIPGQGGVFLRTVHAGQEQMAFEQHMVILCDRLHMRHQLDLFQLVDRGRICGQLHPFVNIESQSV